MSESPRKSPSRAYKIVAAVAAALLLVAAAGWWLGGFGRVVPGADLLAQAPYRALQKHEPEAWARVLAAYERLQSDPTARAGFINVANHEFSAAATRRLGSASPEARLALMRDFLGNLKRLHQRTGDACFRYLYPEVAGGADVAREIDVAAQARTLELAAEVIRTSAERPVQPPQMEEAAQKLGPIIDAVYAEFGTDTQMMAHAHEPGVDRGKVCAIAISLYERMLALPPADAAMVLAAATAR